MWHRKLVWSGLLGLSTFGAIAGCARSTETAAAPAVASNEGLQNEGGQEEASAMEVLPDPLALTHDETGEVRHLDRVTELERQGDLEGALLEGRKALFDDPADVEALSLSADLAYRVGEKHLAVLAYERLSDISVKDSTPAVMQARILIELEDYEGAVTVAQEALKRDSENAEAHLVLGRAQLSGGDLPGAISSFESTLALVPDHPFGLNNLGFALLRANRNEEAVTLLERAVELLPQLAFVHNNLGVAYERMGRTAEARLAYEDALAASPKYLKARLNAERLDRQIATAELPAGAELDVRSTRMDEIPTDEIPPMVEETAGAEVQP